MNIGKKYFSMCKNPDDYLEDIKGEVELEKSL